MNPANIIQDWQCSLELLNEANYKKVQHASLHNSNLSSNSSGLLGIKNKKDQSLFQDRKRSTAKFPLVIHDRTREKQERMMMRVLEKKKEKNFNQNNKKYQRNSKSRKISYVICENDSKFESLFPHQNSSFKRISSKLNLSSRRSILQQTFTMNLKESCFPYLQHISGQIYKSIENSKEKVSLLKSLAEDIEFLVYNFETNRSAFGMQQRMKLFKKQEGIFLFKNAEMKILFHCLLAEIEIHLSNVNDAIEEFQFCQYYSRKQNNEQLAICFLERISDLHISTLNYEQADDTLRNILELAIVHKKRKVLKNALEKISLVYYYRGNSIMGKYYLKKSEEGMTAFENQIFCREFSQTDEIKRLENKLFNLKSEQKIIKRKNNPKFEFDIWRESKQEFQKQSYENYMQKVNEMLKHHDNSKDGRKIIGLTNKISCVGEVKKTQKKQRSNNFHMRKSSGQSNLRSSQNSNDENIHNHANCHSIWGTPPIENVTGVLKTHLSMNREHHHKFSRQQRWKKIGNYLFSLLQQLRSINTSDIQQTTKNSLIGFKVSNKKVL